MIRVTWAWSFRLASSLQSRPSRIPNSTVALRWWSLSCPRVPDYIYTHTANTLLAVHPLLPSSIYCAACVPHIISDQRVLFACRYILFHTRGTELAVPRHRHGCTRFGPSSLKHDLYIYCLPEFPVEEGNYGLVDPPSSRPITPT